VRGVLLLFAFAGMRPKSQCRRHDSPMFLIFFDYGRRAEGDDSAQRFLDYYADSFCISAYRSVFPSNPIPGRSGIVMYPFCTLTPSGKPP
jgi:hypothetical protein